MAGRTACPLLDGPLLIGHRGLGKGVVDGLEQNTLPSFLRALECGVGWVEVDVRRTGDDALVVAHDAAYADGTFVVDLPADDAVARGTLLLQDLLAALPPGAGVSFDLKTAMEDAGRPGGATTAALLAPVVAREHARRPLWVTSFDPGALALLGERAPGVPLGLLTWHGFPVEHAVAAAAHLDVQVLVLNVDSLWPPVPPEGGVRPVDHVLELLHAAGLQLAAWCPRPEQARLLAAAGADALILDDVPTSVPVLAGVRAG